MPEPKRKPAKRRPVIEIVKEALESAFPRLRALLDGDVLERLARLEARVAELEEEKGSES